MDICIHVYVWNPHYNQPVFDIHWSFHLFSINHNAYTTWSNNYMDVKRNPLAWIHKIIWIKLIQNTYVYFIPVTHFDMFSWISTSWMSYKWNYDKKRWGIFMYILNLSDSYYALPYFQCIKMRWFKWSNNNTYDICQVRNNHPIPATPSYSIVFIKHH